MTALSVLLMSPAKFFNVIEGFWVGLGTVCLWVAGVLTFITGYQYFEKSLAYIKSVEKKKARETAAVKKAKPKPNPNRLSKKPLRPRQSQKLRPKAKKRQPKKRLPPKKLRERLPPPNKD